MVSAHLNRVGCHVQTEISSALQEFRFQFLRHVDVEIPDVLFEQESTLYGQFTECIGTHREFFIPDITVQTILKVEISRIEKTLTHSVLRGLSAFFVELIDVIGEE